MKPAMPSAIYLRRLANATLVLSLAAACAGTPAFAQTNIAGADGLARVRCVYPLDETIERIRADIAAKGSMFIQAVDQSAPAAKAGVTLRPSTLSEFGNPPLGAQFLTANPNAGLDWPVRLLVTQDESGSVWATWTDFAWIAKRHDITNRQEQFATASGVVESITSTVARR